MSSTSNPLEGLTVLIQSVAQGAVDSAMVTRGAAWIEQLKREYPGIHVIIMSLLYRSPADVLDALAEVNVQIKPYVRNEHALTYIGALQAKLRGEKR